MADRTQQDVRFRLSAEGQQEVIDAFRKVQEEAAKSNSSLDTLGTRTASSSRQANQAIDLLARQIGIRLPRSVGNYIASLRGIQTAMAAAFKVTVVLAILTALVDAASRVGEFIAKLRGLSQEFAEAERKAASLNQEMARITVPKEAADRVAGLTRELRDAEKASEDTRRSLFGWELPRALQPEAFKANADRIKVLKPALDEAGDAFFSLQEKERVAAEEQKKKMLEEIALSGKVGAERIKLLALAEREAIVKRFSRFDQAALRDQLLQLSKEKEVAELRAEAAKEAKADAEAAVRTLRQLQSARLEVIKAGTENELALLRANNKLANTEEQAAFDEGLVNVETFYANRRSVIESEGEKELVLLQAQAREIRDAMETELHRQKALRGPQSSATKATNEAAVLGLAVDLGKAETAVDLKRVEISEKLLENQLEFKTAVREVSVEQLSAEAEVLSAQGKRFEAARVELAAQIRGLQRLSEESQQEFETRRAALGNALSASIDFEAISFQARSVFDDLAAARADIENQVRSGVIFEFHGQEQIAEIEKDRLPVLREIVQQLQAAAEASGDPQKIQQARELSLAVDELGAASDRAGARMRDLKQSIEQSLTSDLTNFFTTGITQAHSFGEAMRGVALSVVQSLQRIVVQMLITLAVQKLLGGLLGGLGGVGGAGGFLGDIGTVGGPAGAQGGLVRGPGTGTSDSIHARLSNFEYVIRASVVKQSGMKDFLDQLNRGGWRLQPRARREFADGGLVRGFAEGGLVTSAPAPWASNANLSAFLSLDEGLILRRFEASPQFAKAIIRTLDKNRKSANNALGRGR